MGQMFNPPCPGETIKEDILPALNISVTEAAKQLGVSRAALSRVINGKVSISPEMALRIEAWLGVENGGSAELWLKMQLSFDLWHARKAGITGVQRAVVA